jgi:TATA-binding protein-associated factor
MDGGTDAQKRHEIVAKFNSDPSIDVLLLTTNVGGLGLNLTGADTVIFVEHDWNPMKDLQAMDRAHRLGQKRVVNVYRLITQNTIEEKIMGLQRFKVNIANTIINQENSGGGLKGMGSDEILGLFNTKSVDSTSKRGRVEDDLGEEASKRLKTLGVPGMGVAQDLVDELDALTSQSQEQYDTEFDFGNFMQKMKKS